MTIMRSIRLLLLLWGASVHAAMDFLEVASLPSWQLERLNLSEDANRNLQNVIGFADPEVCYPSLSGADLNDDRAVDPDEYVEFLRALGPDGFLGDVTSFGELPLSLKSNFLLLACLCQDDPDDDSCCVGANAVIRAGGAFPGEAPNPQQASYLFIICSLTASAIERVLQSQPPSAVPTDPPTILPTRAPSPSPTEQPSNLPTLSPTLAPTTPRPTVTPGEPTAAPTPNPTALPTVATPEPTAAPVPTVAPAPVEVPVVTQFSIGVEEGAEEDDYLAQLTDAMNSLSPQVLGDVLSNAIRRRLQSVSIPMTTVQIVDDIDCPSFVPSADVCQQITSSTTLIFQPDQSTGAVVQPFENELDSAIARGELMSALNLAWPDSLIYILDDTLGGSDPEPSENGGGAGLGGGGIAGIVVGSVAVLGFLFSRRVGFADGSSKKGEELESIDEEPQKGTEQDIRPKQEPEPENDDVDAILGAVSPDYGKAEDAMMDNDDAIAAMSLGSSSNAGSSGWSSSAGVSSLNTTSQDGLSADGPISAFGTTLAALGSTNDPEYQAQRSPGVSPLKPPPVTRADLDSAIESGDWAAVGATAALLAAASDSQSHSSTSQSRGMDVSATLSKSETSSLDAARAAELDHLVESGDWEGVVLAAAKYESAETESGSGNDTPSQGSTHSKSKGREEYRLEIEDLVRRVVPEEINNVEEMLLQFRGREEELIETLRTMEERAVAQKARQAFQRHAKVQAKQKTPEERAADASTLLSSIINSPAPTLGVGGSFDDDDDDEEEISPTKSKSLGIGQVTTTSKSLGTGKVEGTAKSKSLGTGSVGGGSSKTPSTRGKKHSALEEAIEAGDWEAVGEAAAMLSDHSLASSVETAEINRLADGLSSQESDIDSSKGYLSDRADELEELIERGDWTGVVQTASKPSSKRMQDDEEQARRERRMKQKKEEEEALAQARVWDAIAEQTRQEEASHSASGQAASDAAQWAIGRSLNALVQAEASDPLTREDSSRQDRSTKTEEQEDEEEV